MAKVSAAKFALGIDFGGTTTKVALVGGDGAIQARSRFDTRRAGTPEAWVKAVSGAVDKVVDRAGVRLDSSQFTGLGVGAPGFVDFERGYIYDLPNVPGWKGVSLAEILMEQFGARAYIDNDVNAMALGECTFGAGRLYEHAVFLTLGTGVGGGLLIHNKVYRGAYSMAGEVGHMPIRMYGAKTHIGRGTVEQYVGNQRIVERTLAALRKGRASIIPDLAGGDLAAITPKEIAMAAARGDELGLEIFDFVGDCLATVLTGVVFLLQPQAIVIGGGVAESGSVLFDPLTRHLESRLNPVFFERLALLRAQLGSDAGMIGSATLALLG